LLRVDVYAGEESVSAGIRRVPHSTLEDCPFVGTMVAPRVPANSWEFTESSEVLGVLATI
jgi:hypothetical protein